MLYFFLPFALSVAFTLLVKQLALRWHVVDSPDGAKKLHDSPKPLLGGLAIFFAFWLVTGFILLFHPIHGVELLREKLFGAFVASVLLVVLGVVDDTKQLSVKIRFLVSALIVILGIFLGNIFLERVNNPLGGFLELGTVVGSAFVFLWLMGMMYTTKILDGLDGLATGITTIGALVIFFFTQSTKYFQPNVGLLALILAGACLGFLVFNFYPAKIFLGEAGSLFIGFMLGVIAIISGGKLAVGVLVMALPILDLARVLYVRFRRRQKITQGDREHLHFQLVDRGVGHRQAVLLLYVVSAVLGAATLFVQSKGKVALLGVVFLLMIVVSWKLNTSSQTKSY